MELCLGVVSCELWIVGFGVWGFIFWVIGCELWVIGRLLSMEFFFVCWSIVLGLWFWVRSYWFLNFFKDGVFGMH